MLASRRESSVAFRVLDRRLAARRWAALGVRGRVALGLLAANTIAFAYWQAHGPFMGFVHAGGPRAAAPMLAVVLAAIAIAGGAGAAWRRAALAARPPGPEWLALPLDPELAVAHLRTEARWVAAIAFVPALGVLLACSRLLPLAWIALAAVAFGAAWYAATYAGCEVAWRTRLARSRGAVALSAPTRALVTAARARRQRANASPRWRSEPAWRALGRLDRTVSLRGTPARARLAWAAIAIAASFAAWGAAAPPLTRRALSFAGFMPACALLGAWAIARSCSAAELALRPLPLGLADTWRARAVAIASVVLAAALASALLATGFPPGARAGQFVTWAVPGIATALLGLNYALTLGTRATLAEGLYVAWLAVAVIASLMIPLLGWAVLIAGLVHSTRRLSRWWRPEPEDA